MKLTITVISLASMVLAQGGPPAGKAGPPKGKGGMSGGKGFGGKINSEW
jgi:hypothetical protein